MILKNAWQSFCLKILISLERADNSALFFLFEKAGNFFDDWGPVQSVKFFSTEKKANWENAFFC